MTKAQLQKRLDQLAADIQKLGDDLRAARGEGCYLYFEAEGSIYAMLPEGQPLRRATASDTQKQIIASSDYCHFDCGAW